MEARHKDMLNNFNMDTTNLGWFMICYHENYWDSLEAVKYYEVQYTVIIEIHKYKFLFSLRPSSKIKG